ncbi:zeta toxin family protein [Hydrogenophaga sp. T2]|uniref:zeta toxin family protein n=1 Tax=Hydrogenophaga sp. T2 TaxID=3132823 RepID=UPI003CEB7F46
MAARTPRPERQAPAQPRLRVLAGPNGSGKSTIKGELRPEWIGVFVNADEIERSLRESGGLLHLSPLGLTEDPAVHLRHMQAHIRRSAFARQRGLDVALDAMAVHPSGALQIPGPFDSYLASVLADAIRRELLRGGRTFTFETVMSSRDKVDFMREARDQGYRVYLYFVATDDPAINVDRVQRRVQLGGHPVPERKIRERYRRSIDLMGEACDIAHRAYVFDNSGAQHKLLVQVKDGHEMQIETATLPRWFVETAYWRSFNA